MTRGVPALVAVVALLVAGCDGGRADTPSATAPPTTVTVAAGPETSEPPPVDTGFGPDTTTAPSTATAATTDASSDTTGTDEMSGTPRTESEPTTEPTTEPTSEASGEAVSDTTGSDDTPQVTGEQIAELERQLDEIDALLTDLELDLEQD